MSAEVVTQIIKSHVGGAWDETNAHGVDLRRSLVSPTQITIIERIVRNGRVEDRTVEAWLVLVEEPETSGGYRIVASSDGTNFGLATEGFPEDGHLVLVGWYGDFLSAFRAM